MSFHSAMNVDKENRPPPGLTAGNGKPKHTTPGRITPGRLRKKTEDQYFDVGKVGRKTGITLPDKGVRDANGMEPLSGIFDSPAKPSAPNRSSRTLEGSSDMLVQQSSAVGVDATLHARKTPHFPPPRASTPRHTHIGSPKRGSTGRAQLPHTTGKALLASQDDVDGDAGRGLSRTQPPANRMLDFGREENIRPSIEVQSPFKPKRALRRSILSARGDPFASPDAKPAFGSPAGDGAGSGGRMPREESVAEAMKTLDEMSTSDGPLLGDEEPYELVQHEHAEYNEEDAPAQHTTLPGSLDSPAAEQHDSRTLSPAAEATPSKKRNRASMENGSGNDETDATISEALMEGGASVRPSQKKRMRRSLPRDESVVMMREDDAPVFEDDVGGEQYGDDAPQYDDDDGVQTVDPSLISHGAAEGSIAEDEGEREASTSMPPPTKTKGKGGKGKGKGKTKAKPLQDRHPKRPAGSPIKLNSAPPARGSQSPSKRTARGGSRGQSLAPNFALRATTPFDDAISTSRFGRNVIKPLQYWANESRIWKNGECEGIIRADEIVRPKAKPRKKKAKKGGKGKGIAHLEDISEEELSETESIAPDEWEANLGVLSGPVAAWPPTQPATTVDEDLAFAAPSIVTRDVAGSEFKYAKILTMPFFGAGVVELPPEGFKRAKNARKMQQVFFVQEGKVLVEIGAPAAGRGSDGVDGEKGGVEGGMVSAFAISRGGVWVVPRGNNYAITNESRTKTAKIFFAQGCEVEAQAGEA